MNILGFPGPNTDLVFAKSWDQAVNRVESVGKNQMPGTTGNRTPTSQHPVTSPNKNCHMSWARYLALSSHYPWQLKYDFEWYCVLFCSPNVSPRFTKLWSQLYSSLCHNRVIQSRFDLNLPAANVLLFQLCPQAFWTNCKLEAFSTVAMRKIAMVPRTSRKRLKKRRYTVHICPYRSIYIHIYIYIDRQDTLHSCYIYMTVLCIYIYISCILFIYIYMW